MVDPRFDELARVISTHSCALKPGDKVLIEASDVPREFVRSLVRGVAAAGALPLVTLRDQALMRDLMLVASEEQMATIGRHDAARMEEMDAYIGVRGKPNISEWSDIPGDKMDLYQRLWWVPTHRDVRVRKTKWVILRWPDPSMAQSASMSTEAFEDLYFRVTTLDYGHMAKAAKPLTELMQRTDRVRLVAPGTELSFSMRGIPAIPCTGEYNLPDGEVFSAPVRDSIEGHIQFNTPTIYHGVTHEGVRLEFERGKIVQATSSDSRHLNEVLDSDEGARYTGEFAIGFNPHVTKPMKDILFDEKIAGSLHLTPGSCYDEASNGNHSAIHWDMVLRMTPETGGGEIYFDDVLIRKDGMFVLPELEALNPENLA